MLRISVMHNNQIIRHIIILFFFFGTTVHSQEVDLLSMLDSGQTKDVASEKVFATFKATKIISAQSSETVKKNHLDFRITHRFGNIGVESNGGGHTLWGFDNSEDIRFSFDYGITDKLQIGIGRSKMNELIDGSVKFKLLEQTTDNKIPLSAVLYSTIGVNPQSANQFYSGTIDVEERFTQRLSYTTQLILARKFNRSISLAIIPGYTHRNFVKRNINPNNNAEEENGLLSFGLAGRIKVTSRVSIVGDYFYVVSKYRTDNSNEPYYMPLALGVEIETGGHVFHINLTNSSGINENNFIPFSKDSWLNGGYKFGFNISRVFNF